MLTGALEVVRACEDRLASVGPYNAERAGWYDAKKRVDTLGMSIPARVQAQIHTVLGWPALVVDALEERLNINGLVAPGGPVGLVEEAEAAWVANDLDVEYSQAHLEALIHGVAFIAAQPGGDGDPSPTITIESPRTMTGVWDPVRRDLACAAAFVFDEDTARAVAATAWDRDYCWQLERGPAGWKVVDQSGHGLGRVPVRRLVNRARAGRRWGASEITPSIISATVSTVRTLTRAEVASEFFSAPQLVALGLSAEDFTDGTGKQALDAYTRFMGAMMLVPDMDEPDYQRPDIRQLPASSPAPIIDMIRMYSQLVAGEAALPPSYLGFETANPSSADQIRAIEARHVKRAERKQLVFGKAWAGAILDGLELAGRDTTGLEGLAVNWADAATPTRAATADAVVKQVAAGVLPASSAVTFEQLGYDKTTVERLVADARAAEAAGQAEATVLVPFDNGVIDDAQTHEADTPAGGPAGAYGGPTRA